MVPNFNEGRDKASSSTIVARPGERIFESLPNELLLPIAQGLSPKALKILCRVFKRFVFVTRAILMRDVILESPFRLAILYRFLLENPDLGTNIKSLKLKVHCFRSPFWTEPYVESLKKGYCRFTSTQRQDPEIERALNSGSARNHNLVAIMSFQVLTRTKMMESLEITVQAFRQDFQRPHNQVLFRRIAVRSCECKKQLRTSLSTVFEDFAFEARSISHAHSQSFNHRPFRSECIRQLPWPPKPHQVDGTR